MPIADAASFRDPAGRVYHDGPRILRTVSDRAAPDYEYVRDRGLLRRWIERGWLVDAKEVPRTTLGPAGEAARYVLEHPRVPFVSYPYEWCFEALKRAALLHLDLQRDALDQDVQLSDASAYNLQFVGSQPVFIDALSFRRYRPGDFWTGHRQFRHEFLNPLLLRALVGVPFNAWYRGSLDGISASELNALLPAWRKLSWNVFSQVSLPARLEARAQAADMAGDQQPPKRRLLSRSAYAGILEQLRAWIAKLEPRTGDRTIWRGYEQTHTYADDEHQRKRAFVERFVRESRPAMLWDLGCNTGEYAKAALAAGAGMVVGFDSDLGALDLAFARAARERLSFLPLVLDAANPSPDQGWNEAERAGLARRGPADAILALAFEHHLAIGRNVPFDDLIRWLASLAPTGVIEFVQKDDPTVRRMLASREDVFAEYDEQTFTARLSTHARILRSEVISGTGRRLFLYARN